MESSPPLARRSHCLPRVTAAAGGANTHRSIGMSPGPSSFPVPEKRDLLKKKKKKSELKGRTGGGRKATPGLLIKGEWSFSDRDFGVPQVQSL